MWFTTHTVVGGAIGVSVKKRLWLIAALAVLAHVILDTIPHWDYPIARDVIYYAVIDMIIGTLFILAFAKGNRYYVPLLVAAVLAVVPDFDGVLLIFGVIDDYIFPSHTISWLHNKSGALWGVTIQMILIISSMLVVIKARQGEETKKSND